MSARLLALWTRGFVLWVLVFSALALAFPRGFVPLKPWIGAGLGAIMFGMGMTLLPDDFVRVARQPLAVGCGLLGQFFIMPLLGLFLAWAAGLPAELALGMIIVGACPGGTASNVIAYLARADVALSVTMTACSTVMAVVVTPLWIWALGGHYLPVQAGPLLWSVLQIVLLPVAAGLAVRVLLKDRLRGALEVFPALSVLVIVLIIAVVVALSRDALFLHGRSLALLVLLHNLGGIAAGYGLARLAGFSAAARRAIAIEVGMQNSGLGATLAAQHFGAAAALPAALFSVMHNLTGSLLASVWRRRSD